jgi:hypothetical protein
MAKTHSNLLELVNSDSEDEFASQLGIRTRAPKTAAAKTSNSKMPAAKNTARGAAAAKTAKSATAATKVTKPAPKKTTSDRRASGRLAAAIDNSDEGRAALLEKSANQQPHPPKAARGRKPAATNEVENTEESIIETPLAAKPKTGRGRPKRTVVEEEDEIPETQQETAPKPAPAKRGRKPAARAAEIEIPETQQPEPEEEYPDEDPTAMELDLTLDPSGIEDLPPAPSPIRRVPASVPNSARRPAAPQPRRPSSATTNPSLPDDAVALRRRIGELQKQHAALEARYRDLRDVAARDAEINFDRLRKQTDERAAAASALVESLRSELAAQRELAREGAAHRAQLDLSEARVDGLQGTVTELTTALAEARAENKNLSVKLAAARGTEAAKAAAGVPGGGVSSAKNGLGKAGGGVGAEGGGIHAATVMQMKEDLYGDLTGLIVRGVKNVGGEDVFDCLQTGRNGSK